MNELEFFTERLQGMNRELGISSFSGLIDDTLQQWEQEGEKAVEISLIFSSVPLAEVRKWVSSVEDTPPFKFVKLEYKRLFSRSLNSSFPAAGCCLLDESMLVEDTCEMVTSYCREHFKMVWIINFLPGEDGANAWMKAIGPGVKVQIVNAADFPGSGFAESLKETLNSNAIDGLRSLASLNKVKPLIPLLNNAFIQENRALQVRKLLGGQNQALSRKDEHSSNVNDLGNTMRQAIQKYGMELEKNLRMKYEELNKPNAGEWALLLQKSISELRDFERIDVADKSEKVDIKLKQDYQKFFIEGLRSKVNSSLKSDIDFVQVSTTELITRLNHLLASRKMKTLNLTNEFSQLPLIEPSVKPFLVFNREYRGELMKKGTMEYFVALRDYTGVIMVATGLLAPLTIIASISENGFLKHLSNGVKFGMAGITLILIVYGIYDLKKRIPRKRQEEFEKEKIKAHEYLQNEGKRMTSDVSRDWISVLSNWVKDTSAVISLAVEKGMKDYQADKQQQVSKERQVQQRQQQNLDQIQRNVVAAERIKDQMISKWRDMHIEAEKKCKI